MTFILSLQQLLNAHLGSGLVEDGIPGRNTYHAVQCTAALVTAGIWGQAPSRIGGRASTFGGADDLNDRHYGQAYMPFLPGLSPAEYYAHPLVVPYHPWLRPEMANDEKWPIVWVPEWKREAPANVSYYLDTESLYGALYIDPKSDLHWDLKCENRETRVAQKPNKIMWIEVTNIATGAMVRIRLLDHGPHPDVWAKIDLSPGAYKLLGLSWQKDTVRYRVVLEDNTAEAEAVIGPIDWVSVFGGIGRIEHELTALRDALEVGNHEQ